MYFLTTIRYDAPLGFEPTIDYTRCYGFYLEKQRALKAADDNAADMREEYYNWLLVEEIPEGLHALATEEIWYTWDYGTNRWTHVDKPEWSNGIVSWSIG